MVESSQVTARPAPNQKVLVIKVSGYLNANLLDEFCSSYQSLPKYQRYAIDMECCEGIDSSGLGMLLLLRDYAEVEQSNLIISKCNPAVKQVLDCSNFDQIFTLLQ